MGSWHEYQKAKACQEGELTLEEKVPFFVCLLIFNIFKSQSCTDISIFDTAEVNEA